jgi:hypothetical protein
MADSTLTNARPELLITIGEELGIGTTAANWSTDESALVDRILKAAYMLFLYPPPLAEGDESHVWSFLSPKATITVWPTTTGTVSGSPVYDGSTSSTITVTTAAFYSNMVGKTFKFDTSTTEYTITGYTSTTVLTVSGDASGETASDTYTITADGNYDLPDDFGGMADQRMYFIQQRTNPSFIEATSRGQILQWRGDIDRTSTADFWAVEYKTTDGTEGQRWQLMLYPTPNAVKTVEYRYNILPDVITSSAPYTLGTAKFGETLRLACLAKVDQHRHVDNGYMGDFMRMLRSSVQQDKIDSTPPNMGYNSETTRDYYYFDRTVGVSFTRNGVPL